MNNDIPLSMIFSVENIFNTNLTNKFISDYCGVSFTTISELRLGKRKLENTSFGTLTQLYRLAQDQGLNQEKIDKDKRKGHYDTISLNMPLEKIYVSRLPYDLFAHGFLETSRSSPIMIENGNTLKRLNVTNSIFIDKYEDVYYTYNFDCRFNCGYGGNGPNDLIRFIQQYCNISEHILKKVIFSNDVVEYNFKNNTIKGFESKTKNLPFHLYTAFSKLIITFDIEEYESFLHETDNRIPKILDNINRVEDILSNIYSFDCSLKGVRYAFRHSSEETKKYSFRNSYYHIILEYNNFEIWLPYTLSGENSNVLSNPVLLKILNDRNTVNLSIKKKRFVNPIKDKLPFPDIVST